MEGRGIYVNGDVNCEICIIYVGINWYYKCIETMCDTKKGKIHTQGLRSYATQIIKHYNK